MLVAQSRPILPQIAAPAFTAVVVTLLLLFLMARLIYTDTPVIDEDPYPTIPPVVYEPPPPAAPATVKPTRTEPSEPAPPPPARDWDTTEAPVLEIPRAAPPVHQTFAFNGNDTLPFARAMAPPVYPASAARRGIEGFVDLRFDITASGATRNIQIIYAEPEGVFEAAAQAAVARWRFQPRVVDGKAEPFVGLSRRLRFTLKD